MRLVTFRGPDGAPRPGALAADRSEVIDLAAASQGRLTGDLLAILEAGDGALDEVRALADAASDAERTLLADVELLAPILRPPKILATAGNYQAHIVEGGLPPVDKTRIVPRLFSKPSTCILAPGAPLVLPADITQAVDWELELAVVIGRRGTRIPVERALDHVAGYALINDVSARSMDWGVPDRDTSGWNGFFDWLNGKWLDGFAPFGPALVTADEVPDPGALPIELRVNGEVRQQGTTAELIFGVAEIIAFATRFMSLEPGDVIATGTPAGVGDTTKTYLKPGDVMEGTIGDLGVLRTPVTA